MRPHFEDIQAHYDLSDDFFGLFQDPSRTYSCAYFEPDDLSLEGADREDRSEPGQARSQAGDDAARHRLRVGPTMKRAMEKYDVNVIGLTLSKNQHAHGPGAESIDTERSDGCSYTAGRSFSEPVDRIVSIEAFEHFGFERYEQFFKNCFDILPDDGRMTIQSTTSYHPYDMADRGKTLTFETLRFVKFIITEIFPGGRIPTTVMMQEHGEKAGFAVPEALSLRPHYIKTLGIWGDALEANRDKAIEIPSEEVYDRYMKYLRGCQDYFDRRDTRRQPGHVPQAGRLD